MGGQVVGRSLPMVDALSPLLTHRPGAICTSDHIYWHGWEADLVTGTLPMVDSTTPVNP